MFSQKALIVGNWKMHKTLLEARQFIETLAPKLSKSQATVCLAVPFTALPLAASLVQSLKAPLLIGAQNMHEAPEGAFTGEISATMLLDAGAGFVLIGHSERRHLFHESNATINQKLKRAFAEGLQPILCVGETLEEREQNKTEEVLRKQLKESLEGISDLSGLILAYEPVWAIGTGKVAHPDDAEKAHHFCKKELKKPDLPMLYGGSVNPDNAADLLAKPAVDGLLVGGASLSPKTFYQIINMVRS